MSTTNNVSGQEKISVRFPGISGSEANASAASLSEALQKIFIPRSLWVRNKDNPNTQDMGAVLTIILGSAPAAAIAAGMASWMKMRRVKVEIITADKSVNVSGDGADTAQIIESVFKK